MPPVKGRKEGERESLYLYSYLTHGETDASEQATFTGTWYVVTAAGHVWSKLLPPQAASSHSQRYCEDAAGKDLEKLDSLCETDHHHPPPPGKSCPEFDQVDCCLCKCLENDRFKPGYSSLHVSNGVCDQMRLATILKGSCILLEISNSISK